VEIGNPVPFESRQHFLMQTDDYVETLTDKPGELEKDAQTDFFIDRPMLRRFVFKKTGLDKPSQVREGDLFHFATEVEPILQVLIGKTIE